MEFTLKWPLEELQLLAPFFLEVAFFTISNFYYLNYFFSSFLLHLFSDLFYFQKLLSLQSDYTQRPVDNTTVVDELERSSNGGRLV